MTRPLIIAPLAAALMLAGCTSDGTPGTTPAPATSEDGPPSAAPTSQTEASIDVDEDSGAQDAEGAADLGTAAATLRVHLPGEWQYEGTYGDGARPYAVLVDASQPYDLSDPGSDAYRNSVWVQVETYRSGEESPYEGTVPESAEALATQIADATGGDATTVDGHDVPLVRASYEDESGAVEDLLALHGDLWVLARPWNVDVDAFIADDADGILSAVLDDVEVK